MYVCLGIQIYIYYIYICIGIHPCRKRWKQVMLTHRALVKLIGQSPVKWIKMITETSMKKK